MADVPHLAWPLRVSGSGYAVIEQDTPAELAAAVAVILSFERGSRIEAPDFGITDPAFLQVPIDTSELEQQAMLYEPRAEIDVAVTTTGAGEQEVAVRVAAVTPSEEEG